MASAARSALVVRRQCKLSNAYKRGQPSTRHERSALTWQTGCSSAIGNDLWSSARITAKSEWSKQHNSTKSTETSKHQRSKVQSCTNNTLSNYMNLIRHATHPQHEVRWLGRCLHQCQTRKNNCNTILEVNWNTKGRMWDRAASIHEHVTQSD